MLRKYFHALSHWVLQQPCETSVAWGPILQTEKLKTQDPTASKWQSQDSVSGFEVPCPLLCWTLDSGQLEKGLWKRVKWDNLSVEGWLHDGCPSAASPMKTEAVSHSSLSFQGFLCAWHNTGTCVCLPNERVLETYRRTVKTKETLSDAETWNVQRKALWAKVRAQLLVVPAQLESKGARESGS